VLKHDHQDYFRFAALESDFASKTLAKYGVASDVLNTVYVATNYGQPQESILMRSDAVAFILRKLGGLWTIPGILLDIFPKRLRDWGYDLVARHRYQIFGKVDTCPLPDEKHRHKFLDAY
jgi:predicted DCC family thiol-disulfide oxidoreductase YuxK